MENSVIKNKWKIGSHIKTPGAFGDIYNVHDLKNEINEDLVIKIAYLSPKKKNLAANSLYYENTLINGHLYNFPYRPKVYDTGDDKSLNIRYLIMEKLDYTLKDFFKTLNKKEKLQNALILAVRILKGLEWLHNHGLLLIDLKPDNFMIKDMKLYFIDFGLVKLSSQVIKGSIDGTPNYHSLSVSEGNKYTYKDDVYGMCYMLIYLLNKNKLPWSDAESDLELLSLKQNKLLIENVCKKRDCLIFLNIINNREIKYNFIRNELKRELKNIDSY